MKKILALFITLAMVFVTAQALADPTVYPSDVPTTDCAWEEQDCILDIPTTATITGSAGGGGSGNSPPIIKCKWEYDLDVSIDLDPECGGPCPDCHDGDYWLHDACCCTAGLQVKPILYGAVNVGYFAVVTDPEGVEHVDSVYADIWHPDGTFKYQIELFPLGFGSGGAYDKTVALDAWDHVYGCHSDLIKFGTFTPAPGLTIPEDIRDELNQEEAYLYYGTAQIDYCQPGGWYYVGVRALDGYDAWCDYLFNRYWYIPTAGIAVDFTSINYGTVAEGSNKWVGGDQDFTTTSKPTVRNIGNTPLQLYVYQDDMGFGKTAGNWNVEFDVRLTANGVVRIFSPEQKDIISGTNDYYPGVRIPGLLPLCTQEKLDFSIFVFKGFPGETYNGILNLCALINLYESPFAYIWQTPVVYQENAPVGVPNPYSGPTLPGPV
jgi:hypothetical protein